MKNFKLHFIRHGMTQGNKEGRYVGSRTDYELCDDGIRELIDLRECYEYPGVGVVYMSPMARCIQTAGILYPGREMLRVPQLREVDFGDFEGKTIGELQYNEDYRNWLANAHEVAPPGGESGQDFLLRLVEAMHFMLDDMMKSEIYDAAVVTHGGVIMTLLAALGLPRRPMQEWLVGNGRGYTCFVNSQLWQRDGLMEVAGLMPHGAERAYERPFGEDGIPGASDAD